MVAGIAKDCRPDELIGTQIVIVANLEPVTLMGVESRGMILAASDEAGIHVLTPATAAAPGSKVR